MVAVYLAALVLDAAELATESRRELLRRSFSWVKNIVRSALVAGWSPATKAGLEFLYPGAFGPADNDR